jgi:hypothetical protein
MNDTIDTQWINDHLGDFEALIRSVYGYGMDAWHDYMSALEQADTNAMMDSFDSIMAHTYHNVVFDGGYITLDDTMSRIHDVFHGRPLESFDSERMHEEDEYSNVLWKRFSHLHTEDNIRMVDTVDAILSIQGYRDLHEGLHFTD